MRGLLRHLYRWVRWHAFRTSWSSHLHDDDSARMVYTDRDLSRWKR